MFLLAGNDVNELYPMAGSLLRGVGVPKASRYGNVLRAPRPVTSHYEQPRNRVLFDPVRDANPFFHLMEGLWILAGRNDVAFLAQFNKRMEEFSDNGQTFHAPYGARLRRWIDRGGWELDQVSVAINMLRRDATNRRVVLSIWDPEYDLDKSSKDIPCNDLIKVEVHDDALNLMVFCRSNDIIWGCYGANVVQFSILQEYMAAMVGVRMGWMEQVSADWHAYVGPWDEKQPWRAFPESPYTMGEVESVPMVTEPRTFDDDLRRFLDYTDRWSEDDDTSFEGFFRNEWFAEVAVPMFGAWKLWKAGNRPHALDIVADRDRLDWFKAAQQWMERRVSK